MLALVATQLSTGGTLPATWACLFVTVTGIGMAFPAFITTIQVIGRDAGGGASALSGFGQSAMGAIAAPLVGLFGITSATPMAIIMLVSTACAVLVLVCLARPWQGQSEQPPPARLEQRSN
jgi:DHA1 family bicyclomycin/chloramphenicol resistance-like MFS transporter